MINHNSEINLIKEIRSGNDECFSKLVEQYYRLCVHYLTNAMRIDRETAYDLTQETFARAFKSLSSFDPQRPFRPWLMKICRNLAIDRLKDENRKKSGLFENPTQSPDLSDSVAEYIDLKNAIEKLPPRQKEIVEMHYFCGMGCVEIGEVLAIPTGSVKSDLHFARKQMLKILEQEQ